MTETWRAVIGWEGFYEVSDHGRVKSLAANRARGRWRKAGDRILNPSPGKQGYLRLQLMTNGPQDRVSAGVHGLVAAAFIGPCPEGMIVCHNDGDNHNNHISNLRYDTPRENNLDVIRHGRHVQLNQTHCKRGHPFDTANTRHNGRQRSCRTCAREWMREYRATKRGVSA